MRTHASLLLFLCIALASNTPAADNSSLNRFVSVYTVKKGALPVAETRRTLSISKNNQYSFESITRPLTLGKLFASGQVIERSNLLVTAGIIQPLSYVYFSSDSERERNVQLDFDWENRQVTTRVNGDPWSMSLVPNAQDKLSYQLQIMLDLLGKKTVFRYPVADGGTLKEYKLELLGAEKIRIDLGEFETLRIRRVHDNRKTTFWFAKKLQFLPVRIEQKGPEVDTVTATLKSVTGITLNR